MEKQALTQLIESCSSITKNVETAFGDLSPTQLNWKAAPDKWSIAQCLDHLIITNNLYLTIFKKVIAGAHHPTLWQRWNPFTNWIGKKMVKSLGPIVTSKITSPAIFRPNYSDIEADIVSKFLKHQQEVQRTLQQMEHLVAHNIVIASPVNAMITLKLEHAVQILVVHEERHFQQALRVKTAMLAA